jgi:hypothetical protein
MHLKQLGVVVFSGVVACLVAISAGGVAAAFASNPIGTPQRVVSEQWVAAIGKGDQQGACELQTAQVVGAQLCAALPSSPKPAACPKAGPNAKPPYRKSEIRTAAEQVGKYTAENFSRGFVRINAQVKAKRLWGALGLEQDASGAWRVTYLRYAGETFAPAGTTYQSEAWHKLFISNWCPTEHPHWEEKKR